MFKLNLTALAAGLVAAFAGIGSAQALELTAGNYKITFDNYDSGTTGYGDSAGVKCTTVASCNAAASSPAPGSVGSSNTSADTMGILSVAAITNVTTGQTQYTRGTTSTIGGIVFGPYLTGVFGGLMDHRVEVGSLFGTTTTQARAIGGDFRLWSNAAEYDPTIGPNGPGVDLNAGMYPGITNPGSLFLEGFFAAGGSQAGDLVTTYTSQYSNAAISGDGNGALNFTGGSALAFFDTNSFTNVNGLQNDAYLTTTYAPSAAAPNWTVISTGLVIGQIPEPGSLFLASLALLGLGAASRRTKK